MQKLPCVTVMGSTEDENIMELFFVVTISIFYTNRNTNQVKKVVPNCRARNVVSKK